ncbi:hypothetical protein Bbelb_399190, partial [Branchiostoma belcheri]
MRPVSLLPILAKLLERCVLTFHHPVFTNQYAYLTGSSNVLAAIRMVHTSGATVHSDTLDVGMSRSVSLKNASTDSVMTEEASKLGNWADRNDMLQNGKKIQSMPVCFIRNVPVPPPLSLGGELVPVTSVAKGLGFIFDNKLYWHEHVKSMVSKASSRLHYLLLLTKQGMSVQDLVQVYLSLIRPVLEYGHVLLVGCSEHGPSLKERREAAVVSLVKAMLTWFLPRESLPQEEHCGTDITSQFPMQEPNDCSSLSCISPSDFTTTHLL